MRAKIVLYIASCFFSASLFSQPCNVNVDSLKGQYSGNCKNGKADGEGIASGVDSYTGNFKNGFPDGQGKYTWKNGSWYEGYWKNGLFEGQGTMSTNKSTDPDSVVIMAGFWKKGKYMGSHEKPYVVYSTTNNINELSIRKLNNNQSELTLIVKNITGGASHLGYPQLPKARLTDIQAVEGRFEQEVPDETSSTMSNKYIFRGITFPFYAIFSFETICASAQLHVEKVNVKFFENCNWYVQVGIDN